MATFQEFYADASGANGASNLNAGDKTTSPSTAITNGNYSRSTGAGGTDQFIATGGTPFSTAAVGDYVSVYNDAAAAPTTFIGRITAINLSGLSVDISLTAIAGTRPAIAATGKTAVFGGSWLGPVGASGHPFGFIAGTAVDGSGNTPRVNFKNGTNYAITAAMTHSIAGPCQFEGYTTTVGDGGRAIIDGGTTGTSYILLAVGATGNVLVNLIIQNNGATGSANLVNITFVTSCFNCVFNSARGSVSVKGYFIGCEFYGLGQNNSVSSAVLIAGTSVLDRCIIHDNTGSNISGCGGSTSANIYISNSIFESNGSHGLTTSGGSNTEIQLYNCDFYNNGGSGVVLANTTANVVNYIENCNFVKNSGWGINGSGSGSRVGLITNNGFGAGTQANSSGTTTGLKAIVESGSVNYASNITPWVDPANGDFRINLAAAKNAGRGAFTQTQASYAGTVAYPDIGAGQHAEPSVARSLVVQNIGTY